MAADQWKNTITTTTTAKKRRKKKLSIQKNLQTLTQLIPLIASATSSAHTFLSQNDLHLHPSQTLTLESTITSTALSLTKLSSLLQTLTLSSSSSKTLTLSPSPLPLSPPPPPTTTTTTTLSPSPSPCWFQRFLSAASDKSDPRWVEAFRMSKLSFALLLRTLNPLLQTSASTIPPDYMLASSLFRLAHGASFKSVGRRFGIDSETACRAFYEVCKAVIDRLGYLFEFPSDLSRIIVGFGWISLLNCCGVLGFSRFLVDGGGDSGKDEALIVQGLVDSEGRFLDVSAGWPASMDPSKILACTKLFSRVEESKELLSGSLHQFRDGTSIPQYILGDSCCPLLPWLLTPYQTSSKGDHYNFAEEEFNSVHLRGMQLVSTAFGRLRDRWRLLGMKCKEESVESYPFVIVAGCLLHNFLLKCSEPLPDEDGDYPGEPDFPVFKGKSSESGERVRDALALQLGLVRQRW